MGLTLVWGVAGSRILASLLFLMCYYVALWSFESTLPAALFCAAGCEKQFSITCGVNIARALIRHNSLPLHEIITGPLQRQFGMHIVVVILLFCPPQTHAQRRSMEAEASQRAAERTHERGLATVREDAKKKVLGSLPLSALPTNSDAHLK